MPRLARLDAPGVLHDIIRGIERRKIFRDHQDRKNVLERMGELLRETRTACYAWAFLPNHAHLLLRAGKVPIVTLMGRLLTGYVVSFDRRHKWYGHLFQNRYKSIVCQEGLYFMELVWHIRLNPLRAGIVPDLARGRQQQRVKGRSLFCYWEVKELGVALTDLARRLRMGPAGVGYAVQRGAAIANENGYRLL
jgi:REP element-mobilizing transposase RayT